MKRKPTAQKLRGGYYTPEPIARFLVEWAVQQPCARVLEPSCGDGAFLVPVIERLLELGCEPASVVGQVTGIEVNAKEQARALDRAWALLPGQSAPAILRGDFFQRCSGKLSKHMYDAVVGNPPFIRYQNFPESHRQAAFRLMREFGLKPTRLTNAWLPFVAVATEKLAQAGRIGMVVPAELLQVNYAAELRRFLTDRFDRITVFTFRQLLFEDVQQEVVLLCGERDDTRHTGIRAVELRDVRDLEKYEHLPFEKRGLKPMDHSSEKWTQYFLSKAQIALLRRVRVRSQPTQLGELAEVQVGVVTGLNDFFVLTREDVARLGAGRYVTPLVARSAHLRGCAFSREDWERNASTSLNAFLLTLPDRPVERLPSRLAAYIRLGESRGWHQGFKCRIRDPWYVVPSVWVPDGFLLRQIHHHPRMFANRAAATCTDTIHRVRVRDGVDAARLAACLHNSMTFAFAEVIGRSYGGGVLELEPREALRLPVPYDQSACIDTAKVDQLLRSERFDEALDYCDDVLLLKGIGFARSDVSQLRKIWVKLRQRRLGRKSTRKRRAGVKR